jgi:hypothetical protein
LLALLMVGEVFLNYNLYVDFFMFGVFFIFIIKIQPLETVLQLKTVRCVEDNRSPIID